MPHGAKILLLVLLAVFAFSVITASATTVQFKTATAHTTLNGTQGGADIFKFHVGEIKCNETTYQGTTTSTLSNNITFFPTHSKCEGPSARKATFSINGCAYVFNATTESGDREGEVDIECPSPEKIEINIHAIAGGLLCTVTIPPQEGLTTVTYFNNANDITVGIDVHNLEYDQHAGSGLGACPNRTGTTGGIFNSNMLFTGKDTAGNSVKVSVD